MMMDLPMPPFNGRNVISEQQQSGCADHLSDFQFPNQSVKYPSLKLNLRPRRNSDSVLLQQSLLRMTQRGQGKPRKQRAPSLSVEELAKSIMAARLDQKKGVPARLAKLDARMNSPKQTVQRSASFGRRRLSPIRSVPIRTRSCHAA